MNPQEYLESIIGKRVGCPNPMQSFMGVIRSARIVGEPQRKRSDPKQRVEIEVEDENGVMHTAFADQCIRLHEEQPANA